MKNQRHFKCLCSLLLAIISFSYIKAEDNPCEEYSYINYVVYTNWNILKYDLSNNGTTEPPHVDSVWITDANDSIIQVYYDVQSGDGIDIAFLPRGYYLLFIQMGDCVQGRLFIARGTYPSDVGVVLEEQTHSVAKILCGGQIYILRGDKTYTMQGMEVQ